MGVLGRNPPSYIVDENKHMDLRIPRAPHPYFFLFRCSNSDQRLACSQTSRHCAQLSMGRGRNLLFPHSRFHDLRFCSRCLSAFVLLLSFAPAAWTHIIFFISAHASPGGSCVFSLSSSSPSRSFVSTHLFFSPAEIVHTAVSNLINFAQL